MRGRLAFLLTLLLIMTLTIVSCGRKQKQDDTIQKNRIKIGLALGYAGIGDMAFNDMQYRGLIQAKHQYPIEVVYKVPTHESDEEQTSCIQQLIDEQCDLIFSSGIFSIEGLKRFAPDYPDIHFVLLDNPLKGYSNITSVIYAQHEGSFLAGYLAASFTRTHKIGFIGGVDIPVIKAFRKGYEEGAAYADSKVKLITEYCSLAPNFQGFNDPEKGYMLANSMYDQGIDVIYNVASATGNGIIAAAKDRGKYVIGVDSNQDAMAKGYVLTSMMKRLDLSITDIVGKFLDNELAGDSIYVYGLRNNGVSLTDMQYTRDIIGEETVGELEAIKQKIIDGDIVVTNIHEEYLKDYLDEKNRETEE